MTETLDLITSLQQEIGKVQQNQALQGQQLQQILENMRQTSQLSALQATQITTLVTDVTVIKREMENWRVEISNINAWRADAVKVFVPREEHLAARHEQRITALETAFLASSQEMIKEKQRDKDSQMSLVQWIGGKTFEILTFIVMLSLTLYNLFIKH